MNTISFYVYNCVTISTKPFGKNTFPYLKVTKGYDKHNTVTNH